MNFHHSIGKPHENPTNGKNQLVVSKRKMSKTQKRQKKGALHKEVVARDDESDSRRWWEG